MYQKEDGSRHLRVMAPLHGYQPQDITVRPDGNTLLLFKMSQSGQDELLQTINLPESVDPYTVEARVNHFGQLIVEAPLVC